MPTGTGKTVVLASLVNEQLRINGEESNRCVWIVAHRRELVGQIRETVGRFMMHERPAHGCAADGVNGGGVVGRDALLPGKTSIHVYSIQWLSKHYGDVDGEPGLVVIDEAHHALAETYKELWRRCPEAKFLGMTATPCRLNGKGFTDLFDVLVASDGVAEFVRQGWLSAFDYVSIRPGSEEQGLVDMLKKRGLNRKPGIARLYDSVRKYADGKKGIVYAVSIEHARNIAGYYNERGLSAVAIDGKTPAGLRKRMVDDFRRGRIRVLVNVDVFSEGFDCPDVEFVQLARPTLSLAKYLQQVGRGLRKTGGKDSCMIIDNVGLYLMFGLPTDSRDWQAMFEGRLAGRGNVDAGSRIANMATNDEPTENICNGASLELVITHDKLLDFLDNCRIRGFAEYGGCLRKFRDGASGLYGLKCGDKITVEAQFKEILDVGNGHAAVMLENGRIDIVDGNGCCIFKLGRYKKVKILDDDIVFVTDKAGKGAYVDLMNGRLYDERPVLVRYGNVEMLKVGRAVCSRTKTGYIRITDAGRCDFIEERFYLKIYDRLSMQVSYDVACSGKGAICIFAGDYDDSYKLYDTLADGSVVVSGSDGKYYWADAGKEKRCIADGLFRPEDNDKLDSIVSELKADAERRMLSMMRDRKCEQTEKRKEKLTAFRGATPFKYGAKWGLKLGERVIIPPMFRNIQAPVGWFCAFETNPYQWGVITLDGRIIIEARYSKVEIAANGVARLTLMPGKTKTVKLEA